MCCTSRCPSYCTAVSQSRAHRDWFIACMYVEYVYLGPSGMYSRSLARGPGRWFGSGRATLLTRGVFAEGDVPAAIDDATDSLSGQWRASLTKVIVHPRFLHAALQSFVRESPQQTMLPKTSIPKPSTIPTARAKEHQVELFRTRICVACKD